MDWQFVGVVLILAGAAAYIARATWRTWAGGSAGCGAGCGKCATAPATEAPAGRRIGLPQV